MKKRKKRKGEEEREEEEKSEVNRRKRIGFKVIRVIGRKFRIDWRTG